MEVVFLRCSIAGRVEWGDETVAAVWFGVWRVQVALVDTSQQMERERLKEGAQQEGAPTSTLP